MGQNRTWSARLEINWNCLIRILPKIWENLREKQLENIMCRPRLASTKFPAGIFLSKLSTYFDQHKPTSHICDIIDHLKIVTIIKSKSYVLT